MKCVIAVLLVCCGSAFASDVINLKNGMVFSHLSHQSDKVGLCSACHVETTGTPGKIPGFGKEWAHKTCIECHDTFDKGPTKCDGCHVKK